MNEQNVTISNTAMRYGIIVGLISVIYSFILAMLDETMNRGLGAIAYLFLIGGMVMAFKYFKSKNHSSTQCRIENQFLSIYQFLKS